MHSSFQRRVFHAVLAVALLSSEGRAAAAPSGVVVVRRPNEIEFTATVNAKSFESGGMPGYHAIVWSGGNAAQAALLRAEVSDRQILAALRSLDAKPGDNLSMETWEERDNPKSPAPDTVVAGPAVEVLLRLPGHKQLVLLSSVLEDSAGRGLAMRFGGNEVNIPKWRSGCIVCLYSCPGSKVGNTAYTVRDYARGTTRFRVKPGTLPPDGTPVRVVLRLTKP